MSDDIVDQLELIETDSEGAHFAHVCGKAAETITRLRADLAAMTAERDTWIEKCRQAVFSDSEELQDTKKREEKLRADLAAANARVKEIEDYNLQLQSFKGIEDLALEKLTQRAEKAEADLAAAEAHEKIMWKDMDAIRADLAAARAAALEEAAQLIEAQKLFAPKSIGRDHGRHHEAGVQHAQRVFAKAIRALKGDASE